MAEMHALCRPGDIYYCANPHHAPLHVRQYEIVSIEVGIWNTLYHCRCKDDSMCLGLHLDDSEFVQMMFAERADAEKAMEPYLEQERHYQEFVRRTRTREERREHPI